jgi:hypothetical protein
MLNKLNFVIGIIFIISITCVIFFININNKLETFKREKIKREKFKREKFDLPDQPHHISTESISNLSALATNIISQNGNELNLEFQNIDLIAQTGNINLNTGPNGGVSIIAFEKMICPFYINFTTSSEINKLKKRFWYLCDGNPVNGHPTPDLTGKFIFGNGLINRPILSAGGEATHQLTQSELPSHVHGFKAVLKLHLHGDDQNNSRFTAAWPTPSTTRSAGGNNPHNNMPPYLVLAYFIYLPPHPPLPEVDVS